MTPPPPSLPPGATPASGAAEGGGAVEVRGLHYHYPTSDGSLHDLNFSVAEGESVALVGPNGAGKSTLLLHLAGLLPEPLPRGGGAAMGGAAIRIFGTEVTARQLPELRRRVGLVFQEADDQLFCPTVFEDVAFGPQQMGLPKAAIAERVRGCLERVGLSGFENRSPHRMSGGEKRRACIAGILACEPRLLLLDEPTANLDPRGRRELIALLAGLPLTKLIATHDLEMALALCPRTLVLDRGQLVADGPTRALLGDEELMLKHGLEVPASLGK